MDRLPSEDSTEEEDSKHVCCAQCKCQVGKVYFDGPPPTFIRYSINSSAISFILKPFFEDPVDLKERKRDQRATLKSDARRDFTKEYNDDI